MNKNIVGKGWYGPHQKLYRWFLAMLAAVMLFFIVSWALGHSGVISWNTVAQGESLPVTMDQVNVGPFQLPIVIDNFLLTEYFEGSDLQLQTLPSYVFLALMALVFSLLLAVITTFRQFWYLVGIALVIVFLLNLKLDMLQLFGMYNKIGLILSFVLYLPASYYFQAIRSSTPLLSRFLTFVGLTAIMGIVIQLFSDVQSPFLYIVSYGYTAPVVLSLLFILLVGNEIVTGFVYVTTRESALSNKKNLTHFLIITTIYILNLGLLFFDKFLYLNLGIDFIHPYILLIISTVLGFIFYPLKEKAYGNIFKYYPSGALIFVSLATVCFFTIGYYTYTANGPVLEVFKKFILYGHLGYGLIFMVYVLANFITPFVQGLPVYKVLYDPKNMPYFTFRFAGTIATLAFFLVTNYEVPMFQTISSYYNGLGDLHAVNGEVRIAEVYYRKGGIYGYNNHRSNYAMASIARSEGDNAKAAYHYNLANQLRPTEQSIVNMSNLFEEENKPFQAIFTLQDGLKEFPKSTYIKNNLGLLFDKVGEEDSAFLMFHEVNRTSGKVSSNAGLNLLNLVAKGNYEYNTDSLIDTYGSRNHLSALNNVAVLYNLNNQHDDHSASMEVDSMLNLITGYALYNISLNQWYSRDSINAHYLQVLADHPGNSYFTENFQYASALGNYKNGNTYSAFRELKVLVSNNYFKKGTYYNIMGLLALQQRSPRLAIDYFENATGNNYPEAKQHLGVAYMEQGWEDEAKELWQELQFSGNPVIRNMAERAMSIYDIDPLAAELSDNDRYLAWRYQIARNNELKTGMVLNMLQDEVYKAQLLLDMFDYFMSIGDVVNAMHRFKKISNTEVPPSLTNRYLNAKLTYVDVNEDRNGLIQLAEFREQTNYISMYNKLYYTARIAELEGDTLLANAYYDQYTSNAVFDEQKAIHAAGYFNASDPLKSYHILQNALEVNHYSVALLKQYILKCAHLDFDRFADYALEQLRELIPGQDYMLFEDQYQVTLDDVRKLSGYFED